MGAVTWSSPAQAEPGPEPDSSTDPKVCNDSGIEVLNKEDANELKSNKKDTKKQHPISSHLHERENSEEADLEKEYDIVKFSPEPEIRQNLEPIMNHPTGGRIPEKMDKTEETGEVEDVSNGNTSNTQKTRILSLYDSFISNPSDGANAIFSTALTSTVDKTKSETMNEGEIRDSKEHETFVEGFPGDGESSRLRVRATEPNEIQPKTKENNCDVTLKRVNDLDQATPEESNSTHKFMFDQLMSKILTEVEVGLETEEKFDKQLKIRAVEPCEIQPETEENNRDATLKSVNDADQATPEESNSIQEFKFDELVSKILTEDDVELEVGGELNNIRKEEPERVEGEEVQSEGSNGDEEEDEETKERRERKRKEMEEFKLALAAKRSERQKAIASIAEEMRTLRKTSEELESEREEKKRLEAHVTALKDVAAISRQMLKIREIQVTDLKSKLESLETTSLNDFNELRVEYEKQMENIRSLRQLYDERAAAMSLEHQRQMERERAKVEVLELKLRDQETAFREHNDEVAELRKAVERAEAEREKVTADYNELKERTSSLSCENKALSSQMRLINNLFSHMLTEPDLDLDKLTSLLKDNHNLINDLTIKGDINETAALLVHITRQAEANDESRVETTKERDSVQQEIAENLPKVWRVLLELLSHYSAPIAVPDADKTNGCYKDIETPYGTRSVISVSQTFLRLKDLILEKNSLVKEVGRLKTLNTTLETRLDNQEKRLSVVSSELHKTWGVVSKLRMQHKQLHTSEQILRYELQHKRLMLNELKEELEYCRVKWEEARKKNDQSEEDWLELRKEFSERKIRQTSNSAESGYDEDDSGQIGSSDSPSEDADEIDLPEDDCPSSESVSPEPSFIGNTGELSKATTLAKDEHSQTMTISSMQSPERIRAEISKDGEPVGSHKSPGLGTTSPEDRSIGDEVVINRSESQESQTMKEEKQAVLRKSPEPTISVGDSISLHDVNQMEAEKNEKETETSTDNVTSEVTSACSEDVPNVAEEKHVLENTGEKRFGNSDVSSSIEADLLTQEDMHEVVAQREGADSLILLESEPRHVTDPTHLHSSEDKELQHEKSEVISQPEYLKLQPISTCVPNETDGSCALQNSEKEMEGNEDKQCIEAAENSDGLLDTRTLRLKRLEEQCTSVLSKMSKTSQRSDSMSSRLEELHKKHGSLEVVDCTNTSEARTSPSAENSQTNSNFSGKESSMTCDEILDARALRLTRLEEQCSSLLHKMVKTSERGDSISDKLDQLHEQYGSTDAEASECGLEPKSESETKQEAKQDKEPEKVEECQSSEAVPDAKALRLKRLEEQCSSLLTNMSKTTQRGDSISDQLDQLHEQYGSTDAEASECGLESKIESDTIQGASLVPEADEALNTAEECQSSEAVLDARALRLKRLEEQCSSLLSKMSRTSQRGNSISDKLDQLHEQYGSIDAESSECRLEPKSESKVNQEPIIPTLTNPETGMVPKLDEEQNKVEECKGSEAVLDARALRLKRLEEQCSSLLTKMSRTSQRGDSISEKLEELHSQYGSTETVASSSDRERVGSRPRLQRMRRQSTSSSEGSTEVKDIDKTQEVRSSSDPPPTDGGSSAPMQESKGTTETSERLGYDSKSNLTLQNETSAFETESKGSERDVESKCSSITATSLDAPSDSKEISGDLTAGINEEVEESSLYLKEQLSPGDLSDSISAVDSTDLLVENNELTPSQRKETTQEHTSRPDEVFKSDMESQNETFKNTSDRLENRSLRLKMLENQSQNLFKRLSITSYKREALSNRLESLHEHYGSTENITSLEMVSTSGGNQDRVTANDPIETNSSESSLADLKRTGEVPSDPSVEQPSNNNAEFSTPPTEVSSTSVFPEKDQNLNEK